ncbi:MAG TPA: OmpH family outer membrane protein [Cyclobacteriaceae bacterium]|nr:OmpH family outer membrane protein [Cyclobacteriaceae bacterium]
MKNLSLVLNIVLLIAVGVLYFLHFGERSANREGEESSAAPGDLKVAYIVSDSVLRKYEYLEVKKKQLEDRTKKLDQEYRTRAQGLQNDINDYQRNVGNLTLSQARAVEEDLNKKRQNLALYEQSLTQEMMDEQTKLNKELYDRVTNYLKKYGQEKGLQLVLKYDDTSDLLFGGNGLDITEEVIKGLNEDYKKETVPADSTKLNK